MAMSMPVSKRRLARLAASLGLATVVAVGVVLPVGAATTANPAVSLSVEAGEFSVAAPDLTFTGSNTVAYAHSDQTLAATTTLTATDLTGSGAGWHVTVATDGLTGAPSGTIAPGNITVTGEAPSASGDASLTGVSSNATDQPLSSAGVAVLTATSGNGDGVYTQGLDFNVTVPAKSPVGNYSGTLTISIISGPGA